MGRIYGTASVEKGPPLRNSPGPSLAASADSIPLLQSRFCDWSSAHAALSHMQASHRRSKAASARDSPLLLPLEKCFKASSADKRSHMRARTCGHKLAGAGTPELVHQQPFWVLIRSVHSPDCTRGLIQTYQQVRKHKTYSLAPSECGKQH